MNVTTYLQKQFSNLNGVIHYYADDLTEEEWVTRPGPGQNQIGYTVWHMPRALDHFLHAWIRGTNEMVYDNRWAKWYALKPLGIGVGITLAESDQIASSVQLADVLAYADEVHQALIAWLTEIDEGELDRVPNAQEYLAAFPEYQTPGYLEEINNLFGLPVWGLLIRPCMGHIHRHCGELEITKDILRKAKVTSA